MTEEKIKQIIKNSAFWICPDDKELVSINLERTAQALMIANLISSNLPIMPSFLALRKRAGKTLREVEKSTGISNAYLSQLETGKVDNPSYKNVRTLINYYKQCPK